MMISQWYLKDFVEKREDKNMNGINGQKGLKRTMEKGKKEGGRLKSLREFWREEEGMGTVEIILIIVVLIGLVIIFKTQLRELVEKVFEKITTDSNMVMS